MTDWRYRLVSICGMIIRIDNIKIMIMIVNMMRR